MRERSHCSYLFLALSFSLSLSIFLFRVSLFASLSGGLECSSLLSCLVHSPAALWKCKLYWSNDYSPSNGSMDAQLLGRVGTFTTVCAELQNVEQNCRLQTRSVVHRIEGSKNTCIINLNSYEKISNSSNMKLKPCGRKNPWGEGGTAYAGYASYFSVALSSIRWTKLRWHYLL